jgi:hypothetical protein
MHFWKLPASVVCLLMAMSSVVAAQNPQQRPSPPGQATCSFADGKTITVAYSRPYIRNRKIMGGLVPYGKVWRTGANEATSFDTQAPLKAKNTSIPAGKYTLYTLPSEGTWKLIVNKQTGQWGTVYDPSQDLARIDMTMQHQDTPVDQFTISFEPQGDKTCVMKLEWENTSASVEVQEAQ